MNKYFCDRCDQEILDKPIVFYDRYAYFPSQIGSLQNVQTPIPIYGVSRRADDTTPAIFIGCTKGDYCVPCMIELLKCYEPIETPSL